MLVNKTKVDKLHRHGCGNRLILNEAQRTIVVTIRRGKFLFWQCNPRPRGYVTSRPRV